MKKLNRQIFTGAGGQTPGMCYPLNLRVWLVCVLSIILSPFTLFAQAPAISYSSPQTYETGTAISQLTPTSSGVAAVGYGNPVTFSSGFHGPDGLAVDASGNLYVSSDSDGTVKKIPAGGGTPVVIGSGFNAPAGITVDAAGNVYVADLGNKAIKKIPAAGGVPVSIASGLYAPHDVAVDAAGNVYIANGGDLLELPAAGGAAVFIYGGTGSATAVVTVSVDAAGNVYFGGEYAIYKMPAGSYTYSRFYGWIPQDSNVAINSAGNVYMAEGVLNVVGEIPAGGGAFVTRISGYKISNIAMDAAGNIYACNPSGTDILEFKPTGGYCIHPVLPAGLSFDENTGIISGTPTEASPAANYAVTAYNSSGSNTATVNIAVDSPSRPTLSYSSPQTYTAGTAIAPLKPASSGVAALGYGNRNILASNLANPSGITTDAAGNVYVACSGDSTVKKIPAGGGAAVVLGSGFNQPIGVAVDAAGNVYVACYNDGAVKEIPAAGGAPLTLASGITSPNGIAADAAGNVYVIAGLYYGSIYEIPAGKHVAQPYLSNFTASAICIDAAGNIYVATTISVDDSNGDTIITGEVEKIPAGGGPAAVVASVPQPPTGMIADAAGNLYLANGLVQEVPAGGGAPITLVSDGTPYGVALDAAGNLYIIQNNYNALEKYSPVGGYYMSPLLPAGLTFDETTGTISGTPTTASPATNYTITAYNYGGGSSAVVNINVNPSPLPAISYNSPQTYTAHSAIVPLAPASSGVAAVAYNSGSVLNSGFAKAQSVAADAAGNVYVAVTYDNTVTKIPAGGGAPVVLGSGFDSPVGLAVDAAGNVYVADFTYAAGGVPVSEVKKIPAAGGVPVTLSLSIQFPKGIAVDAAGNVYVTDLYNGIIELPVGGSPSKVFATGLSSPSGVCVDAAGNVYVACSGEVEKIPAGGGPRVHLGFGFGVLPDPKAVAVDAAGDLYVADDQNGAVYKIPPGETIPIPVVSAAGASGVAVDGAGNLYVTAGDNLVEKYKPVGGYYVNTPLPAGLNFDETTGIISGTPAAAGPATNYTVNAYNIGGSAAATVNIKVLASSTDADLSALQISSGTLMPGFAPGITSYTASVLNNETSIAVTPTTRTPGATVNVNGAVVASGKASANIPLNVGPNTITTVATALDGATTQTYTLTVNRDADATLKGVTLSTGSTPTFSSNNTYTASVSPGTTSLTLTPTASDPNATITVNFVAVKSGTASRSIAINNNPTIIYIQVTGSDGVMRKNYTLSVSKNGSSDAGLDLALSTGSTLTRVSSVRRVNDYNASVTAGTSSLTVTPTASDPAATITVDGVAVASGTASQSIAIKTNPTLITVKVTAQDGVTFRTNFISVYKNGSSNAGLSVALSTGSMLTYLASANNVNYYSASVTAATGSLTVTPTAADPNATITVDGVAVASGTASQSIAIGANPTVITVQLTAQDGTTVRTRSINVYKDGSSDAGVAIALSTGSVLTRLSSANNVNYYSASVSAVTSALTVTPTASDPNAKITVDGVAVASGTASKNIAINTNPTVITVKVTAQDGTTVRTNSISVYKNGSSNAGLSVALSTGSMLTHLSGANNVNYYSASVSAATSALTVTPTAADPNATITVNGITVASGTASQSIAISTNPTVITVQLTAQDGVTIRTRSINVYKDGSSDAGFVVKLSTGSKVTYLSSSAQAFYYLASVKIGTSALTVTPTASDPNAAITVNGVAVTSGTASQTIALNANPTVITVQATAQDGVTVRTHSISVYQALSPQPALNSTDISVSKPADSPLLAEDGILVHQGISPNGDGINDFLQIDNISQYPDNKLSIMNRNGQLIYEAKGYDNSSKVFDGHSNKNGQMQLPGTYFYQLDYTVNGITKHKTGFLVLKY